MRKTKEQLLRDLIAAQADEIIALRCAVAYLQQHRDGFFPNANLKEANGKKALALQAVREREQEEQLNPV